VLGSKHIIGFPGVSVRAASTMMRAAVSRRCANPLVSVGQLQKLIDGWLDAQGLIVCL
jgi:hypothetical protein